MRSMASHASLSSLILAAASAMASNGATRSAGRLIPSSRVRHLVSTLRPLAGSVSATVRAMVPSSSACLPWSGTPGSSANALSGSCLSAASTADARVWGSAMALMEAAICAPPSLLLELPESV